MDYIYFLICILCGSWSIRRLTEYLDEKNYFWVFLWAFSSSLNYIISIGILIKIMGEK